MKYLLCLFTAVTLVCNLSAQTLDSIRNFSENRVYLTKEWYTKHDTVKIVVKDTVLSPSPSKDTVVIVPIPIAGTKLVVGKQGTFDSRTNPIPARTIVNAVSASWTNCDNYPINWAGGKGGSWIGGTVVGCWNQLTTPWDVYHSSAGMYVRVDSAVVKGFHVTNFGDCVRFMDDAITYFVLTGAHCVDIHDDGVENDAYKKGRVEDSFFDGVYVCFSARPGASFYQKIDGSKTTYQIYNNLCRLKPFALTYKSTNAIGTFFKIEVREPARNMKWVVTGNVFRVDGALVKGSLCLNQYNAFTASNNIIVWTAKDSTGKALPYPCLPIPAGWRLTTDVAVWDSAVVAWKARHP
jgi:hypothetical protein